MHLSDMKAFFLGKRGRHDLAEEAVPRIHVTHDGTEYDFTAEEVDQMLGVCKQCKWYQMRIKALEIPWSTPNMPDKRVLLVHSIEKHDGPSTRRRLRRIT